MKTVRRKTFSLFWPLLFSLFILSSCKPLDRFAEKAKRVNRYERVSLHLSRENRELKSEMSRLKDEIQTLKSEKSFLQIKLDKYEKNKKLSFSKKGETDRAIASFSPQGAKPRAPRGDMVKFDIYKWTPTQILAMAEKEFKAKNFEKSAQFFTTFSERFPHNERINDTFLFQAGVAAYESGDHKDWTIQHLERLVEAYPTSQYYRGAKLWMALTYLQLGDDQKFFETVEEFRKKYRNTDEWKILGPHYERIVQKYKRN